MRYITTNDTSITFTDVDGKVKIVPKNRVYTHFNTDTVTFLLIERYDNEGICLFASKAEDLQINGETYTFQELLDGEGISDLFSPTGLSFEVVEELPQSGEEGTIYLVPNEQDTYTEYIWLPEEETWEAIGDTDVDLDNYYTKSQVDALIPTNVSDLTNDAGYLVSSDLAGYATETWVGQQGYAESANLSTVATTGDYDDLLNKPTIPAAQVNSDWNAVSGVAQILNKPTIPDVSNYYTKTESDNKYLTKTEFDTKEEVISTALNDLDTNKQDVLTAGTNITIENNVISASGGGTQVQSDWNQSDTTAVDYIKNKPTIPDTSDFVSVTQYNPKELAIAEALTDLNENKADKSEIPVVPDMTNYYTKTETDNTFVSQTDFDVKEEVISTALNDLNNKIGDIETILQSI